MRRFALAVLLAARAAAADPPHGFYSLDALDPPYGEITIADRRLESCGDRTADVLAKLHSFEVAYVKTKAPNKRAVEAVRVNGEAWRFGGLTDKRELVTAKAPLMKNVDVAIWFGVQEGEVHGNLHVVLWDGTDPICGDVRRLGGTWRARAAKR